MPETALMRQNCAEGLSGGADNGCYGKCTSRLALFMSYSCLQDMSMFLLMTEPAINDCGLAVTNAPESPFILRMLYPFAPHSSPAFVKHIPQSRAIPEQVKLYASFPSGP